jgi:regulatory protein
MAQSWRVEPERNKKPARPLDSDALERLALHYVGRYATSRAKLRAYLERKVKTRGWEGAPPDFEGLVQRLSRLGYVDDAAYARGRAASLQRRGYGERRLAQALGAAGISEEDSAPAKEQASEGAMSAALQFARRRRIGPFASAEPDREARQKAFAAMVRAGHPFEIVRRLLDASPEDIPDLDKI